MSLPTQDLALSTNMSPAEERFERLRKRVGWYLAPIVLVVLWFIPFPGLSGTVTLRAGWAGLSPGGF